MHRNVHTDHPLADSDQRPLPPPASPGTDEAPGGTAPSAPPPGHAPTPREGNSGSVAGTLTLTRPLAGGQADGSAAGGASSPSRLHSAGRWAGDGLGLTLLGAVVWWLADHDGGFEHHSLVVVSVLALLTTPWAVAEARRLPRWAQILLGAWGVGGLASIAFAAVRAGATAPAMTTGLVALVGLASMRLWRRPWGPPALLGVLLLGFGAYWHRSFLQWWGKALLGQDAQWMALSWWNQSGILMGAFGLLFAGLALRGRRVIALAGGVVAAMAFAGTWLSGSRGAPVFTALGLLAVAVVSVRALGWRRAMVRLGAVLAGAAVVTGALIGLAASSGGSDGQPIAARGESASGNALLRLEHMGAAIGMLVDAPLTGQGLGSYRYAAPTHTSPDGVLTSSAHNEYLETLAEGGLAMGLPFLGLAAAAAFVALRRLRPTSPADDVIRRDGSEVAGLRDAVSAGAAGLVVAVGAHAAFDFDWGYPIIPALFALAVAVLATDALHLPVRLHPAFGSRADAWTPVRSGVKGGLLTVLPLALLLAVGTAGAAAESRAGQSQTDLSAREYANAVVPWDVDRAEDVALTLSGRGEHDLARRVLTRATANNPGLRQLRTQAALVDYRAGVASAEDVAATLRLRASPFWSYNLAAETLIEGGDHEVARTILREALDAYPRFGAWGVDEVQAESEALLERATA